MQISAQSYRRYVCMALNWQWKKFLDPCPLLGDQANKHELNLGSSTCNSTCLVRTPGVPVYSKTHFVTAFSVMLPDGLPKNWILKVTSCPGPLGCIASKIQFEADIPISCRSLGGKKILESKSSYSERHFFSILIPTAKGHTYTALVSVLCKSLWTEYYYW